METNGDQKKKNLVKAGGLWLKMSQKTGNDFYAGTMTAPSGETFDVMIFANKFATPDNNQPLFNVYRVDYGVPMPDESEVSGVHPF